MNQQKIRWGRLWRVVIMALLSAVILTCSSQPRLGQYYAKKIYTPVAIPDFQGHKAQLPQPILEGNPGWIDMYWRCWEIAFQGFKSPPPGSPLVSNWLDEAFSENIFQWDTIFMIMFARYGHDVFPSIESLDNFYALQYESGFIGREFRESDGQLIHFDFDGGLFSPKGWKNMINPPLFAWAEVESYRITGDAERLQQVLPALEKYAEWLNRDGDPDAEDWESNGRISKTTSHKLYWNTPLGSGMDNTPRPAERGAGWVEMSSQMVIMYSNLAIMCDVLEDHKKAEFFRARGQEISDRINRWCWNEADGFYYDVLANGEQYKKKTIGGFWPLLAGVPSLEQADKLIEHLTSESEFWRPQVFPTLSADEPEYVESGGYWLGSIWSPTNVMVIKGLEKYGADEFAAEATERYLAGMYAVFVDSNTVYENYAPEFFLPGDPAKADFVGWTGCGPIQLLFENVMGLRPDGFHNKLLWKLRRTDRHGVEQLKLGDNQVSVLCESRNSPDEAARLTIYCEKAFQLVVEVDQQETVFELQAGEHLLEVTP